MASDTGPFKIQPWGALPVEQYLLQYWSNRQNDEDNPNQYQQLVREFVKTGAVILEPPSSESAGPRQRIEPDNGQIHGILKPWRSTKLRDIATALKTQRTDEVVVLRTYYGEDPTAEEEMMRKIMFENEEYDVNYEKENAWWQFLNDRTMFNFGDHWEKVYEILPELTMRGVGIESLLSSDRFTEAWDRHRQAGHDPYETVEMLASLSAYPLAIIDKETFATSKLKLLFIDVVGNVVRSSRIETPELGTYRITLFRGAIRDWEVWEEAEIGEKYQPNGDIERVLRRKLEEAKTVV